MNRLEDRSESPSVEARRPACADSEGSAADRSAEGDALQIEESRGALEIGERGAILARPAAGCERGSRCRRAVPAAVS